MPAQTPVGPAERVCCLDHLVVVTARPAGESLGTKPRYVAYVDRRVGEAIYLDEARRWGIQTLPIDINESKIKYSGKHNWIRPGLMHIRNLSKKSMERIIEERGKSGRFHNLNDFIKRVNIYQKEIEYLILVGAFDGFGLSRPESLFLLDGIYNNAHGPESRLFFKKTDLESLQLHPGLSDYNFMEKCLKELHMLGYQWFSRGQKKYFICFIF